MLRVYRALLLAEMQAAAQYRIQSILWLLLAIVRPVVFLAAWDAVATSQGGSVGGYDTGDFAAYYVTLTLVGHLTQAWDAWDFEQEVRQGTLAPKLLRPLHPIHYAVAGNLIYKISPGILLIPVLALISWTFHARFTAEPWQYLAFLPSVLIAAALRFAFGWLTATLAFWTTRVQAVLNLLDRFTFVFAGQVAPLSMLPGPLQSLAYVLPFGYMLGVPAEVRHGGSTPAQVGLLLLGQVVWLVVSIVGFRLVWRAGLRQFSAVGA